MKISSLVLFILFTVSCTTVSFNPETKELSYFSTKEYKSFEATYEKGDTKINFKAKDVGTGAIKSLMFDAVGAGALP